MPRRALLAVALVACALAGCGTERAKGPDQTLPAGTPALKVPFKSAGMTVAIPVRMLIDKDRKLPSVFRASFSDWYVAGFAYRRTEALPKTKRQLNTARKRLLKEVKQRNKRLKVIESKVTKVAKVPAVEVLGDQVLSQTRLRTRSLHLYKGKAEYVLEVAAPVSRFADLDRTVFRKLAASVRVTGKIKQAKQKRAKKKG